MKNKKIAIASDHAGFYIKEKLVNYLREENYEVKDFGTFSADSVDYPDFIHPVAKGIDEGMYTMGIVICGSGQGANMVANKYQGVRCALCWNMEQAELSRRHNNANIVSLPARFISDETAVLIVKFFLETAFEGGRHELRINKIPLQ